MLKSLHMPPRDSRSPSAERNSPSVEEAFQAAPEEQVAEIVDGELHLSPRPARPHAYATSRLGVLLGGPFGMGHGGPGGWILLNEPEFHLGPRPDKLVPDLAGWRRERLPEPLGWDKSPAHFDLAPDWACEVLSKQTRRLDKGPKMRIYAREGVRHLWHLDPLARTLEVFRLEERDWLLVRAFSADERVRAEPFEALEFELSLVWAG